MNEFVKKIKLEFEADPRSIKDVESTLSVLKKHNLIDEKSSSRLNADLKEYKKTQAEITVLKQQIEDISKIETEEARETLKILQEQVEIRRGLLGERDSEEEVRQRIELVSELKEKVVGGLQSLARWSIDSLKSIISESIAEMRNMLDYSRLSNSETRDIVFTYGFNSAQAYAFDKSKELMGIGSDEDLYYMNDNQRTKFQEYFTKYADKYSKLYDSGFFDTLEEYQFEMADFKEEIQMEVIRFFIDNKDTIKAGMHALIQLTEFVISSLGWLVKYFGGENASSAATRSANTNDIINNYSNASKATNVKIDNTFNNVAANDKSWLQHAGQMTYEQVLSALR